MIQQAMIWAHGGQVFECLEIKRTVRKDGAPTSYAVLGSQCPECGVPFISTAALNEDERGALTRRCVDHRRSGRPVAPRPAVVTDRA